MWALTNLLKDNKRIVDYFYEEAILQKVYAQLNFFRNSLGLCKVTVALTETFCKLASAYFEVRPFLLASAMTPFMDEFFKVFCDENGYFENVEIDVLAVIQVFFLNIPEPEIQQVMHQKRQPFAMRLLNFLQSDDSTASLYAAKIILEVTGSKDPASVEIFEGTQLIEISVRRLSFGNYAIIKEVLNYIGNIMMTPGSLCTQIAQNDRLFTEVIQKLNSNHFESEALRILHLLTLNGHEAVRDLLLNDLHFLDVLISKMQYRKNRARSSF